LQLFTTHNELPSRQFSYYSFIFQITFTLDASNYHLVRRIFLHQRLRHLVLTHSQKKQDLMLKTKRVRGNPCAYQTLKSTKHETEN